MNKSSRAITRLGAVGLSAVTTGALVATFAAPASAATTGVTQTPPAVSTSAGACQIFTVKAADNTTINITATRTDTGTNTSTATFCTPHDANGQVPTDAETPTGAGGTGTTALTGTATTDEDGNLQYGVSVSGSPTTYRVTATNTATNASGATSTLTTVAATTGNNSVATITASPTSATAGAGGSVDFAITALDANKNPVAGVTVRYTIAGPDSTTTSTTAGTCGGSQNEDTTVPATSVAAYGQVGCNIANTTANGSGTDTVTFFVDQTGNGSFNSGVRDSGEPTASATAKFVPNGTSVYQISVSAATGQVGSPEVVTATETDGNGNPEDNADEIQFSVTGANSVTYFDDDSVNEDGNVFQFTYVPGNSGIDHISAHDDNTNNGGVAFGSTSVTIKPNVATATPTISATSPHKAGTVEFKGTGTSGDSIQLKYKNSAGTYVNHGTTTVHNDRHWRIFTTVSSSHKWLVRAEHAKNSKAITVKITK